MTWVKAPDFFYDIGFAVFVVDRRKMMIEGLCVDEVFKDDPEAIKDRMSMLLKKYYPSLVDFQIMQIQWLVIEQVFAVLVTHPSLPSNLNGQCPTKIQMGDVY